MFCIAYVIRELLCIVDLTCEVFLCCIRHEPGVMHCLRHMRTIIRCSRHVRGVFIVYVTCKVLCITSRARCYPLFTSLARCFYCLRHVGGVIRSDVDWLVRRQCHQCHLAKQEMWAREVCLTLVNLALWAVRTLVSRTKAYTTCDRPTLYFIERFVLGRSILTSKPLLLF